MTTQYLGVMVLGIEPVLAPTYMVFKEPAITAIYSNHLNLLDIKRKSQPIILS